MNKTASIEKILAIEPHTNADSLEIATVLGWKVCVKKGEFKPGDLVVYVAIDSVLDAKPEFEFLRNKHFRIKTIKLRGQVSQGICFPLSLFNIPEPKEGQEVSEIIGAKHYEVPLPAELRGNVKRFFPGFLKKTDETNLKGVPEVIFELQGKQVYITRKYDGSSATYYTNNGEFGVCSRNMEFKEDTENSFTRTADLYSLKEKMLALNRNIALQGELYGPGIQGNPMGTAALDLAFFSLFDIDKHQYLGIRELEAVVKELNIPLVHKIWEGEFNYNIAQLQEIANEDRYPNGSPSEGIVIRPVTPMHSYTLNSNSSVKIISEVFDMAKK